MTQPVALRVRRPYPSEAEFLKHEAWTIEARHMLLLDQDPLDSGTLVRFELCLEDGASLMRAEGRVVETDVGDAERPGGLRVRFRKFGASTKAFIQRAIEAHTAESEPPEESEALESGPRAVASTEMQSIAALTRAANATQVANTQGRHSVERLPNRDELLERLRQRPTYVTKPRRSRAPVSQPASERAS